MVLVAAGLAVLVLLCGRLGLGEVRQAIERADPGRFAAFLALSAAVFVTYAVRCGVVLRAIDASRPSPSTLALTGFRAAEHAVSTLLPAAHLSGEPVRVLLLRRRGHRWTESISAIAMDRMLDVSASSIAGPVYVGWFFLAHHGSPWAAPWILAAMIAATAALALFYVQLHRGGTLVSILARRGFFPAIRGSLETIDGRLAAFLRTPSFGLGLALSLLAEALILAELWMLSRAFALPLSLPTLAGVMVGMGVAQLVPVPGALGSLEAAEVGVLALAGGSAPLGLAVGLLVRVRETLWVLLGLAALYLEGLTWRGAERPARAIPGKASAIEPNE